MSIRAWLLSKLGPPEPDHTGHVIASSPRGIADGAHYAPVVTVPRGLSHEQRASFLESARTSMRFQFDTPQRSGADEPIAPTLEDPLDEWNASTREAVIANCHTAYHRNPQAKASVDYTADFVVGDGMNISYRNEAVKEVLETFIDNPDNPVRELEKSLVRDLQLDGELVLRFFEGNGDTTLVPLRPWELHKIEHEPGFVRRPVSYQFHFEGKREDVPADEILHVAVNRGSYEQRGRPDLYVSLPWLRAHKEWLEDRARRNYWLGNLIYHVRVAAASVTAMAAAVARWAVPMAPGSVAVTSDKEEVQAINATLGAADAGEDGRQLKLMAAVGVRMPEYMLSDGENANLATTSSQELPALIKFQGYQNLMIRQVWTPSFRRVIANAVAAGLLPEDVELQDAKGNAAVDKDGMETGELIPATDAFEIAYEPLNNENMQEKATALEIANSNGWISDRTASTEMGFDYDEEQEQIETEMATQRSRIEQGLMPPPPPMMPLDDEDEDATDEAPA